MFPQPWSNSDARTVGGVLYTLVKAAGGELEVANANIQYLLDAMRISTATGDALDSVASDFFGETVIGPQEISRSPGEDDDALRNRIKASLLLPLGTREAISELIRRLTGQTPRMLEPWDLNDTGAYEANTYWDIDTVANPARYADPSMRYQGAIESILPAFGDNGEHPVWCYDIGASYDTFSAYWLDAKSTWWLNVRKLDALINKSKIFGTTIWRKYRSQPLTSWPLGGTQSVSEDSYSTTITIFPPFSNYSSIIATPSWNTTVDVDYVSNSQFRLTFGVPAPSGATIDWYAAPVTVAGFAVVPVQFNDHLVTITVDPSISSRNIFVSPNWNTTFWLADGDNEQKTIEFGVPAPDGSQLSYAFIEQDKSGWIPVEPDTVETIVPLSTRLPFQAFAIPTWNTNCEVIKSEDHLTVKYQVPPVGAGRLYWGIHES